jgi:Family of unknown function (DUF6152)
MEFPVKSKIPVNALLWLALWAGLTSGAQAHHSLSGQFDVARSFEISGVVSKVEWMNPHTYIYVDVAAVNGAVTTYKLESLPVAMMRKAGVSKQLLLGNGQKVRVNAHPARNGSATLGYMLHIAYADGHEYQFGKIPDAPAAQP